MKKLLTIAFIVSTFILNAQIPFDQIPSFETDALGHYSTGLGIADINVPHLALRNYPVDQFRHSTSQQG